MNKHLIILLFGITIQAQTFDFSCVDLPSHLVLDGLSVVQDNIEIGEIVFFPFGLYYKTASYGGSTPLGGTHANITYHEIVFSLNEDHTRSRWVAFNYREDTGELIGGYVGDRYPEEDYIWENVKHFFVPIYSYTPNGSNSYYATSKEDMFMKMNAYVQGLEEFRSPEILYTYYNIPWVWGDFRNTGGTSGAGDTIYRYKDTDYVLLITEGNVRYGTSINGSITDIVRGYDVHGQDWNLQQAADALVKYINIAGEWEIYSFTDETGQEIIWNELEAPLTQLIPEYSCLSYVLEVNTRNFIETFTNVDIESRGCLPPNITTFTYNIAGNLYTFQQGDVTVANTILFSNNNNTMTWTNAITNEVKIWNRK